MTGRETHASIRRKRMNPPVKVLYKNHRGETAIRTIIPIDIYYGTSKPYHPEPQWLVMCWDMDKEAYRTYALGQCNFPGADTYGTGDTREGPSTDTGRGADAPGGSRTRSDTERGSTLTGARVDRPRQSTHKSWNGCGGRLFGIQGRRR